MQERESRESILPHPELGSAPAGLKSPAQCPAAVPSSDLLCLTPESALGAVLLSLTSSYLIYPASYRKVI